MAISYDDFYRQLYRIYSQDPEINAIPLEEILDNIPTIDRLDLPARATVLLRAELDVPLEEGRVVDVSRIETNLRTLRYCLDRKWKVVIIGHIGRDKHLTVEPVCGAISKEIDKQIEFVPNWLDEASLKIKDSVVAQIAKSSTDIIFMLENMRQFDIERALWRAPEKNFKHICDGMYSLATDMSSRLADIEINEAIAASNFDFSSSVLPLAMSQTAFGFFISEELKTHIKAARRSNMIVISGLKIDKLDDLEGILERGKIKWVVAAGSLAMALKKAEAQLGGGDFRLGRADTDEKAKFYIAADRIEQGKRIVKRCREAQIELILPIDFILDDGSVTNEIPDDRVQFDIGPESRNLIRNVIADYIAKSKQSPKPFAMSYNGVFGKFEDQRFEAGTREFVSLLRNMTEAGVLTYVGGGEGRLALLKYGSIADVTHAFTAGGTILKSLSDRHIQFLKAMYLQNVNNHNVKSLPTDTRSIIEEFRYTMDLRRIELLADQLSDTQETEAIDSLIYRLGDIQVQSDPDVEDAVCGALVKFGVMLQLGNLIYHFENDSKLNSHVKAIVKKYRTWIPAKYFK